MTAGTGERRRLTRSADFDAVYRRGRSRASRHLVVYVFPREPPTLRRRASASPCSRKVGGAVERNRVKRVLREAAARIAAELSPARTSSCRRGPASPETLEAKGLDWAAAELLELARPRTEALA